MKLSSFSAIAWAPFTRIEPCSTSWISWVKVKGREARKRNKARWNPISRSIATASKSNSTYPNQLTAIKKIRSDTWLQFIDRSFFFFATIIDRSFEATYIFASFCILSWIDTATTITSILSNLDMFQEKFFNVRNILWSFKMLKIWKHISFWHSKTLSINIRNSKIDGFLKSVNTGKFKCQNFYYTHKILRLHWSIMVCFNLILYSQARRHT